MITGKYENFPVLVIEDFLHIYLIKFQSLYRDILSYGTGSSS